MRIQSARLLLGGGAVVASAGIVAALGGHPLGIGVAGPGLGAVGIGGGYLADARRASAEADLPLSMAAPGGLRRVWRSDGVERHLMVEAAARAFFIVIVAGVIVGTALELAGRQQIPTWSLFVLWGFAWTVFPACLAYVKKHVA